MDEEYRKLDDDGQGNHPQPHYDFTEQPPYKFYEQGITEPHKVWWQAIAASIRNAHGRYLVTIAAVWALCEIACEFLERGSNSLSYKSIIGTLLFGLMILTIGLVSLRRVENTNAKQKEKREENKADSAESGTGRIGPGQDRRTSTRDGGSNHDGGGKQVTRGL